MNPSNSPGDARPRPQSAAETTIRREPRPTPPRLAPTTTAPRRSSAKLERAQEWLTDYLTASGGRAESADVKAAATKDGISLGRLLCAAGTLARIESIEGSGHRTVWTLLDPDTEPGCRTAIGAARQWLADHLTAAGGRAPRREAMEAGVRAGHRAKTIDRARAELGVHSRAIPGALPRRTEWLLPATADAAPYLPPGLAAEVWLTDYLVDHGGSADSGELLDRAVAAGHGSRTLDRARKRCGIRSEPVPGTFPRRTVWVLDVTAP